MDLENIRAKVLDKLESLDKRYAELTRYWSRTASRYGYEYSDIRSQVWERLEQLRAEIDADTPESHATEKLREAVAFLRTRGYKDDEFFESDEERAACDEATV